MHLEFWKSGAMEYHSGFDITTWKDLMTLDTDVLVEIFQYFDIFESTSGIAYFANAWRRAGCDPPLWETLDFSTLKSHYIKVKEQPYVHVAMQSDWALTCLLNISLSLSQGNIMTLIFHYNLFLTNDQFTYTAERCPRLRRLVFLAWNRIKKTGMCKAIQGWKDLESLTMPSIENPQYVYQEISINCKNFRELKVMGPCHISLASSLAKFLPNLKVLSLRCSKLYKDALILILDRLQHLEVLNISHCFLVEAFPPQHYRVLKNIDQSIHKKAYRLREFLTCMKDSCIMCQRTRKDEGLPRWYRYEQGIWKADEVSSLAL